MDLDDDQQQQQQQMHADVGAMAASIGFQGQHSLPPIENDVLELFVENCLSWHFDTLTHRNQLSRAHIVARELSQIVPIEQIEANFDRIYESAERILHARALRDPPARCTDFLFVTSYPGVCNLRALRDFGITHVLNAASGVCRSPFQATGELEYLNLDLNDDHEQVCLCSFSRLLLSNINSFSINLS